MKRIILSTIITALVITGLVMAAPSSEAGTGNVSGYGYAQAASLNTHNEYWDSYEQLESFIKETKVHITIRVNEDGVATLKGLCFFRAESLSRQAEDIGKRLEIVSLSRTEYFRVFGNWSVEKNTKHFIIGAMVMDGNYYYIDPKTKEIVIDCYVPNNRIAL